MLRIFFIVVIIWSLVGIYAIIIEQPRITNINPLVDYQYPAGIENCYSIISACGGYVHNDHGYHSYNHGFDEGAY